MAAAQDVARSEWSALTSAKLHATRTKNAQKLHVKQKCVCSVSVVTDGSKLFASQSLTDLRLNVMPDAGKSKEMKRLLVLLAVLKTLTTTRAPLSLSTTRRTRFNSLKITWSGPKRSKLTWSTLHLTSHKSHTQIFRHRSEPILALLYMSISTLICAPTANMARNAPQMCSGEKVVKFHKSCAAK